VRFWGGARKRLQAACCLLCCLCDDENTHLDKPESECVHVCGCPLSSFVCVVCVCVCVVPVAPVLMMRHGRSGL